MSSVGITSVDRLQQSFNALNIKSGLQIEVVVAIVMKTPVAAVAVVVLEVVTVVVLEVVTGARSSHRSRLRALCRDAGSGLRLPDPPL